MDKRDNAIKSGRKNLAEKYHIKMLEASDKHDTFFYGSPSTFGVKEYHDYRKKRRAKELDYE